MPSRHAAGIRMGSSACRDGIALHGVDVQKPYRPYLLGARSLPVDIRTKKNTLFRLTEEDRRSCWPRSSGSFGEDVN
jgi:hypothetical protein